MLIKNIRFLGIARKNTLKKPFTKASVGNVVLVKSGRLSPLKGEPLGEKVLVEKIIDWV
jgi:hypothetical protein